MAEDRFEGGSKKDRRESQNDGDAVENGYEEEEPDFSDPEDFVDDVEEDGNTRKALQIVDMWPLRAGACIRRAQLHSWYTAVEHLCSKLCLSVYRSVESCPG
jgi:hypothetical protein